MIQEIKNANTIIIGGNSLCRELLICFFSSIFLGCRPTVIGVADNTEKDGSGIYFAREKGIPTYDSYEKVMEMEHVDLIITTISRFKVNQLIDSKKLTNVKLIDYAEAMFLIDLIRIENIEQEIIKNLKLEKNFNKETIKYFKQYSEKVKNIVTEQSSRFRLLQNETIKHERYLFQIVQGSTIPTFVIDQDHMVTHWNKAAENFTGYQASQMLGTRDQWCPFWQKSRPTMADIVLDQVDELEIKSLYGNKWKKSDLIEGGYEAELFFPNMGNKGKWCWFTAAPIKSLDGSVIGAIETLWDTTEKKKVEAERKRHTARIEEKERTLAQIVQGSTIPTFVIDQDHMVTHWNKAAENFTGYQASQMLGTRDQWRPFWQKSRPTMADIVLDQVDELEIKSLYGNKWKKSDLIEGGYEAELFFPNMGNKGKWCWFTAAPIKSLDGSVIGAIETLWDTTEKKKVEAERKRHTARIEEKERTLAQIVQGSTIPTFVIDQDHMVTHWNKAAENFTGYQASQMLGTRDQWRPFWQKSRPTMADIVLDQIDELEIKSLYGNKWKKSDLIEGGYEAELFFPNMGNKGKWCWFTAVPIKSLDGSVIGAIETLWDTTVNRKAQTQRKRYIGKLEEKEKELAQIIQGSTTPTFVINREHIITHWNHALERLTGYKATSMLGTSDHWRPFANERKPIMADVILEQLTNGEVDSHYSSGWKKSSLVEDGYESEEFFSKMGNNGRWLFFTAAPIKSSYNAVVGIIQTFWDVSLSKQAEGERQHYTNELATLCSIYTSLNAPVALDIKIRNTIEEIREFFHASRLCLYMSTHEDRFDLHYFNSCITDTVDYSFIDQSETDAEIIRRVSKKKKPTVVKNDNFSSTVYIPIGAKEHKVLGVMQISKERGTFSSDDAHLLDLMGNRIGITLENSLLQEELELKSKFQSNLIKSSNDGIIATDDKWKTVIFNPAARDIFGYDFDDSLIGNDIREFFPKQSLDILRNNAFLSNKKDHSSWYNMEITTKAGTLIPVRFYGSILREKQKMIGTVAFFQDLREIKHLEEELVQSEKLAAVGQTVAGMAHCIKNILHGFKGGRYLMDVGTNKNNIEKIKDGWSIIQRNINRTSDLVMDLLSYSKERSPEPEICHPHEILDEVYDLLIEVAKKHEINLIKKYSYKVGEITLDPRTVHRCMMNLVTNAIDACLFDSQINKEHYVILKIEIVEGKTISFIVEDNGCGMSEKVKSKLFSSFFSTKGVKGTGLGLLVTSKLVEEHDGSISCESEEGKGTKFSISLPLN